MASEQSFGTDGDSLLKQKWNLSASTTSTESADGCFDCNICFESALEPVVTLCGHLYCWPCIYEWLHVQSSSPDPEQQQQNCPVCKADISYTSLVPLYGRGMSSDSKAKKTRLDMVIPPRAPSLGANTTVTSSTTSMPLPQHPNLLQSQPQSLHHHHEFFSQPQQSSLGDMATASIFNPYGEMVYARIFGSSGPGLLGYPHTNSYPFVGNSSSPRMRRQEMQLHKSLNRVSTFLFCCIVLCLLLF